MAKKNKEARQRKRQAKLVRRKQKRTRELQLVRREKTVAIVPYSGRRYNQKPFVEAFLQAEIGIFEADAQLGGRLTDAEVRQALEYTIRGMRHRQLTLDDWQIDDEGGLDAETLVAWNIGCRWQLFFEDRPIHSRDDLIGILRRILFSVDVWTTEHPGGRGYIKYLAGQMNKLGVSCESISKADVKRVGFVVD